MAQSRIRWKYLQKRSCEKNWINKLGFRKYEKSWYSNLWSYWI